MNRLWLTAPLIPALVAWVTLAPEGDAAGAEQAIAVAATPAADPGTYSPPARSDNPERVFFGNVTLHTRISAASFILGAVNATPAMRSEELRGGKEGDSTC